MSAKNQTLFPSPERKCDSSTSSEEIAFWTGNQSEIQIQGQDGLMMERNLGEILSPPACLTLSHKGLTLEKPSPVGWKDIKEERN